MPTAENHFAKELEKTIFACYAAYQARFNQAARRMPGLRPWVKSEQNEIRNIIKKSLAIEDGLLPVISVNTYKTIHMPGYRIELLQAQSWPGVFCAANLYIPSTPVSLPLPFVLLCCGHGAGGKLNPGYQAMAARLARQGAVVLVPDNIGQGERSSMHHRDAVTPFACGLTVQGLIIMETMAWLDWAQSAINVDKTRFAAIGNSGGGTLTLFLAALYPELTALSCSGYLSSFQWVAQKEKKHCHCNILPGVVGQIEMWQVLGLFAPRPLYVFQGNQDNLFPEDLFYAAARQISHVYQIQNSASNFHFSSLPGAHPWDCNKRYKLAAFLQDALSLAPAEKMADDVIETLEPNSTCYVKWPEDARDIEQLASCLSGQKPAPNLKLWDIYPPEKLPLQTPLSGQRGDHRQIMAQFEAFLTVD